MLVKSFLLGILLFTAANTDAQVRAVENPGSPEKNLPRSHAIDAGDYIYISGQGPQRSDGTVPADFEAQATQSLENIKAILDRCGLGFEERGVRAGVSRRRKRLRPPQHRLCKIFRDRRRPLARSWASPKCPKGPSRSPRWPCAISRSEKSSVPPITVQRSRFRRASSPTIACSFPPCRVATRNPVPFPTIPPRKPIWRSMA